jgi:hypothetical protein
VTRPHLVGSFGFGEGPRWHEGRLWFTDNPSAAVKVVDGDGLTTAVETPKPSGLGWLDDGTLVVSSLGQAAIVLVREGSIERHDLSELGLGAMMFGACGNPDLVPTTTSMVSWTDAGGTPAHIADAALRRR